MADLKVGKLYDVDSASQGNFVGRYLGGDRSEPKNFAKLTMTERMQESVSGENWNELDLPDFRESIVHTAYGSVDAQKSVVAMMFSSGDPEKMKAAVKTVDPNAIFGADNNGRVYTDYTHPTTQEITRAYVQAPGFNTGDVTKTVAEVASIAGPGKLYGMGKAGIGMISNAVRGAGAGFTGSVGRDVTSNVASGDGIGEAVIGEGKVDIPRAATEGLLEAGGTALFDMIPIIIPSIKKYIQDTGGRVIDRLGNPTIKIQRLLEDYGIAWEETTKEWRETLIAKITSGDTFDPAEAMRLVDANTLPGPDVPLTRGSISGQPADQLYEDQVRKGVYGEPAAIGMRDFDGTTQVAIDDNLSEMQRLIAGDGGTVINRGEGAELVQESLSGQRTQARTDADDMYEVAKEKGADATFNDFPPEANLYPAVTDVQSPTILNAFTDSMESYLKNNFAVSDLNGSGASELLKDFRNLANGDTPATVNQLMLWRQKLNSGQFGTPDSVARKEMRKRFDDHFEQAMQDDLISGSPESVQAWKDATDNYKDFARTWKDKDLVDRLTQTKPGLGDEVAFVTSPADAANFIFNTSNLGFATKKELQRDILKMKKLLPPSEFNLLRQELFIRIMDSGRTGGGSISGAKLKSGFEKMMRENSAVMNAAFPLEQINMMKQFARVADLANNTARNNSNSGIINVTNLRDLGQKLALMFSLRGQNASQFMMQLPFLPGNTFGSKTRAAMDVPGPRGYQGTPQRTGPVLPSTATALLNEEDLLNLNEEQQRVIAPAQ